MRHTHFLSTTALVTAMVVASAANAGTLYLANLTGASEVPPNASTATGRSVFILNDAGTQATITTTHTLNAAVMTGGHVHRGVAGVNGPVIFGFPNPLASPIGPLTWAIPATDLPNLQNGGLYVNLHTQSFLGGEIRGQLIRARLAPSATNAAQTALANALDVSAGFSSDLDSVLVQTNVASATVQAQTLDQLGATSIYAQGRQGVDTMASFTGRLLARADDARGANSASRSGFMPFASISYDFGTRSATASGPGSKSTRPVFVAGGAFAGEAGEFGLALGYADGKDKLKNNLGQSKVETTSIQAFGSSTGSGVNVDVVVGYGDMKVENTRNIAALNRVAISSPEAKGFSVAAKLSSAFELEGGVRFTPYALLDHQSAKVDAYSESGAGAVGLIIPKLKTDESGGEIGGSISSSQSVSWGTLTPRLQVGYRRVIDDSRGSFNAALVGSPNVTFATPIQVPGRNGFKVDAALAGVTKDGLTTAVGYRGTLGQSDQKTHAIELRVSFKM